MPTGPPTAVRPWPPQSPPRWRGRIRPAWGSRPSRTIPPRHCSTQQRRRSPGGRIPAPRDVRRRVARLGEPARRRACDLPRRRASRAGGSVTEQQAWDAVRSAVGQVAPDVDPADLVGSARLRQDLELDSLDFLRVLETIAQDTGVDVPEDAYREVA